MRFHGIFEPTTKGRAKCGQLGASVQSEAITYNITSAITECCGHTLGMRRVAKHHIRVVPAPPRSALLLRLPGPAYLLLVLAQVVPCSRRGGRTGSGDDLLNVS